ncbi:MAG: hypothetical protein JXR49_07710 [Acidobacteria bacterium]|nr:hypothetical protein [Acidobacteriota bacterium]
MTDLIPKIIPVGRLAGRVLNPHFPHDFYCVGAAALLCTASGRRIGGMV